ncbi:MAG TPA: ABC transporter permease, partial [Thermoanaerobaculia bacterium]|nr:ABC transporter permease [Thermoanaerobaculia bacterium]
MKRHLLKLMWNRKRQNALVAAEIFVSFLVLFVVAAFGVYFTANYRKPLGFETAGIWHLEVGMHQAGGTEEENAQRYATVLTELERMPEVRRAAAIDFPPYFAGYSEWTMNLQERRDVTVQSNRATEGLDEVLGLRLLAGRWFSAQDDGMNWKPVVLDRAMAEAAFGRVDVVGERAYFLQDQEEHRVVGVIEDFRRGGELSGEVPYIFFRATRDGVGNRPPQMLLAMRPGVDASFEETLIQRVSAVAPEWSFSLQPLERERASSLRVQLMPLVIGAIVALFLVLMVALGLTGIMWQTV